MGPSLQRIVGSTGGDVDDRTTALGPHYRQNRAQAKVDALGVDAEGLGPGVGVRILKPCYRLNHYLRYR